MNGAQSPTLVTGAAGFIGFHVAQRLLERGECVIGLDNVNNYYDVRLKEARLAELTPHKGFSFVKLDLANRSGMRDLFADEPIRRVVHLAAQAGVRHSLVNPHAYTESNIEGFMNILEGCRNSKIEHLVYASSSSVYGGNTHMPFSIHDNVDHPASLYAATKKANELMAHCYAHLYRIPCTGLRFFTVYGPWGRPDMALFIFTKAILEDKPIKVFNNGKMKRDFTYIEDVAEGVIRALDRPATANPSWTGDKPDPGTSSAPARIYNIGNHQPVELLYFIEVLEKAIGKKAGKIMLPLQPGDVPATYADIEDLTRDVGFKPVTPIEEGIPRFVKWYRDFYRV
jgi:UDP-glucuronate 4-epimerase